MSDSIKPNDPALVAELLANDSSKIIEEIILGFPSADLITTYDDVDGSINLYTENIKKDLILGWAKDGRAQGDEFEWGKLTLTVEDFMVNLDVSFNERSVRAYRKLLEKQGQSADEYSLIMYLTEKARRKMRREVGIAFWQAKVVPNVPQTAPLKNKFDGIRTQAKALAQAGIARTSSFGSVTASNAIAAAEAQYDILATEMKKNGSVTVCSYNFFDKYKKNYRDANKHNPEVLTIANSDFDKALRLDCGNGEHFLLPLSEFGDDDALLTTDMSFLSIGYNLLMDWKIKDEGRQLIAMCDLSIGALIEQRNEGYIVVNDILIANS